MSVLSRTSLEKVPFPQQTIAMLGASVIAAACMSGVLGNYGDSDKVSGVTTLHITCYDAADCTGTVIKRDYKSVGACYQSANASGLIANEYKKGVVSNGEYIWSKYTDDACTAGASGEERKNNGARWDPRAH